MVKLRAAGGRLSLARLLLRPNPPLSRRTQLLFLGVAAVMMSGYGLFWASQGFWPILPFAGLEFGALALALAFTGRRGRRFELIEVDERDLRIRRPGGGAEDSFRSGWARVRLVGGDTPRRPVRLQVGAHGRWVELGSFLTEAERRIAADHLRRVLHPHGAWR